MMGGTTEQESKEQLTTYIYFRQQRRKTISKRLENHPNITLVQTFPNATVHITLDTEAFTVQIGCELSQI